MAMTVKMPSTSQKWLPAGLAVLLSITIVFIILMGVLESVEEPPWSMPFNVGKHPLEYELRVPLRNLSSPEGVPNDFSFLSLPHSWDPKDLHVQHLPYPEGWAKPWRNDTITLGYLYYNELNLLKRVLDLALQWETKYQKLFTFLIIDDGSTIEPAQSILIPTYQNYLSINVVTILRDVAWNIGGARNLLAYTSNTRYFVQMDIDHYFDYQGIQKVASYFTETLSFRSYPDLSITRLRRNSSGVEKLAPCCLVTSVDAYWYSGGCDEDFVGHYGKTDPHFYWKVSHSRMPTSVLNDTFVIQFHEKSSKPSSNPKNTTENRKMINWKKNGQYQWSNTYLRFPWRIHSK